MSADDLVSASAWALPATGSSAFWTAAAWAIWKLICRLPVSPPREWMKIVADSDAALVASDQACGSGDQAAIFTISYYLGPRLLGLQYVRRSDQEEGREGQDPRGCRASPQTPASPPTAGSTCTTRRCYSTPAGDAPSNGTDADFARWQGHNQLSRFTVRANGTRGPGQREKRAAGRQRTAGCAATSAGTSTSTPRQPLHDHRRRHAAVVESSGYTPIDERHRLQLRLRRPAHLGQHQRPARQAAADQALSPTGPTPSRAATSSPRARPRPAPRSTRWASATPSG